MNRKPSETNAGDVVAKEALVPLKCAVDHAKIALSQAKQLLKEAKATVKRAKDAVKQAKQIYKRAKNSKPSANSVGANSGSGAVGKVRLHRNKTISTAVKKAARRSSVKKVPSTKSPRSIRKSTESTVPSTQVEARLPTDKLIDR